FASSASCANRCCSLCDNSLRPERLLDEVDRELAASETRLREMERYVTSDTFTLRSRFRQL
ncbi:hypothetical protein ACUOA5_19570, partial [Escherichia coli]